MSANRYSVCPKCVNNLKVLLDEGYGKLTRSEYDELTDEYYNQNENLREDWEIWLDDYNSTLNIRYICSCGKCGFKYKYETKQNILEEQK